MKTLAIDCGKFLKKKESKSKNRKIDFTKPYFKKDFNGDGYCGVCNEKIKTPGACFFLKVDEGQWPMWHADSSCFPSEYKDVMKNDPKFKIWNKNKNVISISFVK